jgi:hypothetical protein
VCLVLSVRGQRPTEDHEGEPFSVRLTEATDRAVASEARRTRRSKSAIVEALTEEAMRVGDIRESRSAATTRAGVLG